MAQTGTSLPHVAYRGSNQVINDVVAGHVKIACDNAASAVPQSRAGNVRPLAVSSLTCLEELPDVPTLSDTLPGFEALTWFGFVAPSALPKEIENRLVAAPQAVSHDPATRAPVQPLSAVPRGLTGDGFGNFVRSALPKWGPWSRRRGSSRNRRDAGARCPSPEIAPTSVQKPAAPMPIPSMAAKPHMEVRSTATRVAALRQGA